MNNPLMRRPRSDQISSSSASSSSQPQQPQHNHFQHPNFESGGMPVNLWRMDRRDVWRTCFCFHVRTVTIFIGVWHLMVYILALSFMAAMFMYEPTNDGLSSGMAKPDQFLPTPLSKSSDELHPEPKSEPLTYEQQESRGNRMDNLRNSPLNLVVETRKGNSQVILLTVCNMLITLLMVYGAVRGKPSYLMPFFVLRVFDFCIFCLTMVGYFSYLPNVTDQITNTPGLPFREDLLQMDPQLLSLFTLVFVVALIAVKAYIIGVIWNCYKYLMLRNTVIRGVIAYRHDDPTTIMGLQQTLLPDLPDYDTAVNDPRYAKKPPMEQNSSHASSAVNNLLVSNGGSIAIPPPPPYSVAVAAEPVNIVLPIALSHEQEEQPMDDSTPPPPGPPEAFQGQVGIESEDVAVGGSQAPSSSSSSSSSTAGTSSAAPPPLQSQAPSVSSDPILVSNANAAPFAHQ